MRPKRVPTKSLPDTMIGPACEDGGGFDAASALAFRLVDEANLDFELGGRFRLSLGGDADECAALKLGMKVGALRRACKSGKADAAILAKVCRVYGVHGDWLLTGQEQMKAAGPVLLPDEEILTLEALEEMEDRVARLQRMIDGARSLRKDDDKGAKNQDGFDWL